MLLAIGSNTNYRSPLIARRTVAGSSQPILFLLLLISCRDQCVSAEYFLSSDRGYKRGKSNTQKNRQEPRNQLLMARPIRQTCVIIYFYPDAFSGHRRFDCLGVAATMRATFSVFDFKMCLTK